MNKHTIPTELNIAPRGKSWLNGQLIDGVHGHPTRQGMENAESAHPNKTSATVATPVDRKDLVPGVMRCAKCEFQLVRQVLAVNMGEVFAGDSKTEPCPNDCGPLWPVTWKQYAEQAMDAAESMADRAFAAEKEVKQLRGELSALSTPNLRAKIMSTPLGLYGTGIGDIGTAYRAGHRAALLTAADLVASTVVAAPAAVAVPDERAAFERVVKETMHDAGEDHIAERLACWPDGAYKDRSTGYAWWAWQHRAALAATPAAAAPKANAGAVIPAPAELLERVIDSLSSFAGNKPHTEADMTAWEQLNDLLSAAPPAGWKLVPIEPTAEMLESAGATDRDGTPATYKTLYMAMVGAASVVLTEPAKNEDGYLPCPFCGSDQVSVSIGKNGDGTPWHYVECESCAAMTDVGQWNERALLATATGLPAQSDMPDSFREWFAKNYPADTIIVDPDWHAKSIFRMAQAHARLAAPQAQADAREAQLLAFAVSEIRRDEMTDSDLLDAMEQKRIAVVPEYEGPWDAEVYNDEGKPNHRGSGSTPREAIRAAIAATKEGGAA